MFIVPLWIKSLGYALQKGSPDYFILLNMIF